MPDDPDIPSPAPIPGPTPTGFQRTQGGGVKWVPPTAEHLSKLLPQYDIECILGYGGMGAVYKGKQKSLDRTVAIKILPPGLEDEDASYVDRFKNEARIMAKLDHPAIVPVYDFGETSEGQLYIVMSFVDGTDVQKMLEQQGRLPSEHALAITAHVCDALKYAHEHGVIHRDIKPANILINMEGAVKVADFGLAKAEEHGSSGITKTGMAMGTPDYVAPEALIMGVNVDGRADLYAVGVMLYAMLTGNVPRGAFKPVAVMLPGTDPRFDKIVHKAMQMDREERYQTAAEIRRDLDVILTTPLVQAGGVSSAAIPKQSLPHKPVAKGPQKPMGKSANVPVRQGAAGKAVAGVSDPGSPGPMDRATAAKSKAPVLIGIGAVAAIAVGAFVMLGGKKPAVGDDVRSLSSSSGASGREPSKTGHQRPGTSSSSPTTPIKVREEPKPAASPSTTPQVANSSPTPAAATKDAPFVNTLGMKFVPVRVGGGATRVERVLFSVWDVRVQDYAAYAAANPQADGSWTTRTRDGVPVGLEADHPVVGVSWGDAQGFCKWLMAKETAEGTLPPGAKYRLPTDEEWSWAVGLPPEVGTTPAEKNGKNTVDFPWGTDYPPKKKVGNYGDESYHAKFPKEEKDKQKKQEWIDDYNDGYAVTSPVGSFPANASGLYDMGGNVWQWCEDWFDAAHKDRVLRGASWGDHSRDFLLASTRQPYKPLNRINGIGFRCVLAETSPASSGVSPAPPPAISNSKSPISSSSSPAFPPGQWVKVFTKAEDLPEDLRRAGLKFNEGSIDVPQGMNLSVPLTREAIFSRCGVRARVGLGNRESVLAFKGTDRYFRTVVTDKTVLLMTQELKGRPSKNFDSKSVPASEGESATIETFIDGSRWIARRSDQLLTITLASDLMEKAVSPSVYLGTTGGTIRDIEVINLDGIPEAEALRILGVDEKGNDTRAAVLAAEKRAMEQKQVAQAAASIPELATLDEQLKKLTAERVTAPFEAEVAKLNSGYLGGLDRKRAEEKAAGHLDSVLAIEAEKKLVEVHQGVTASSRQPSGDGRLEAVAPCPIPSAEDDATSTTTPAVLKGLRQIYRDAYAKIDTTRAANLKALTDPLTTRLKLLESDLTKKDRIADAKTVKEYREALAEGGAGTPARNSNIGGEAAKMNEADKSVRAPLNAAALKDGFTNSLGMKFVPVKGTDVLFCIHETRYKDYATYAANAPSVDGSWKDQSADGFTPTDRPEDHPVMKVSWEDAQKFCAWLSKKEVKTYRLPTDQEWSYAVGIGRDEKWEKDTTPATIFKNTTDFPWGDKWPPPKGCGNYSDQSRKAKAPRGGSQYLEGYDDGFPITAPAMSFKPNKLGLYDLSGNVWEWCEDWYDNAQKDRVLRGGSWFQPERNNLLSSRRTQGPQAYRGLDYGFRVVLDTRSPTTTKPATPTPPPVVPPPAPATAAKSDFSNSLGMKFVKVPGTQVLFCIHETRRQDYAAYATEVPGVDAVWKGRDKDGIPIEDTSNHPVGAVIFDDAVAFCVWLGKKEGRTYRLPTDKEWSHAVGIGREENWTKDTTPEALTQKVSNEFPWDGNFPPKNKDQAGNYSDSTARGLFPTDPVIDGYTDGFASTAPIMSFKSNKLGIYDMGGNVWEWVDAWYNTEQKDRVLRGASFRYGAAGNLLSSYRLRQPPASRNNEYGFRIVVEMTAP